MKKKDLMKELSSLSEQDLNKRLSEHAEELENLRFQGATGQLTNPIKLRTLRRNVARIHTILNNKS